MRVIPVLLYHSVSDHPSGDDRYAVPRAAFEAHADLVAESGRTTLRITELADRLRDQQELLEHIAAITFDDGFADNEEAVHSLVARGLQATLYVTTGELGGHDRFTRSQVAQLAQISSIEFGAHAVRHRHLDELNDRDVAHEVRDSKLALEDIIQSPVHSFAYPHGAYDNQVRQSVIHVGYRSAVAVKNALSHEHDDPFAIARFTVTTSTSPHRIAKILQGKGIPLAWPQERLRTRVHRTVRRGRARIGSLTLSRPASEK